MNDSRDVENKNKAIVGRAFDDWVVGVGGGVFALLAPDAVWTIVGNSPVSRSYQSRDEFLNAVIRPFNARLATPLVPDVHSLYADGDMVIAYFDAAATVKDGTRYDNSYTWYLELHDGVITNAIAFFDSIAFTDLWNRVSPD